MSQPARLWPRVSAIHLTTIAAGMPLAGPSIAHAYQQNGTQIVVTVTHDQGTDSWCLCRPRTAPAGR